MKQIILNLSVWFLMMSQEIKFLKLLQNYLNIFWSKNAFAYSTSSIQKVDCCGDLIIWQLAFGTVFKSLSEMCNKGNLTWFTSLHSSTKVSRWSSNMVRNVPVFLLTSLSPIKCDETNQLPVLVE